MNERAAHREENGKEITEPEESNAVDSSADQAKKREREMEKSGEENAG